MTSHIIELAIQLTTLFAIFVFARGFDERITVLEKEEDRYFLGWEDGRKQEAFDTMQARNHKKEPTFAQKKQAETKRMNESTATQPVKDMPAYRSKDGKWKTLKNN